MGWLFVLGVMAFVVGATAVVYRLLTPDTEDPDTEHVVRETPDVITAIRDLARLETTSFHMEKVMDLRERQRVAFGLMEAEDAILLVAGADITAGIDLTRMRDGDVVVDPQARVASLTLPAPEIFSAALDNKSTYVHTRDTDTLARRNPHLETRARREAEQSLRDSAIEGGFLSVRAPMAKPPFVPWCARSATTRSRSAGGRRTRKATDFLPKTDPRDSMGIAPQRSLR